MHWAFDQAAINAYKLATVGKTWMQGHLEFRRALYTKLLAYSKSQVWKDVGPHKWTILPTRKSCAWCSKVAEVRRKVQAMLEGEKEAGKELLKGLPDITIPPKGLGGCDYCKVPLCKIRGCWTKWHSQDAT